MKKIVCVLLVLMLLPFGSILPASAASSPPPAETAPPGQKSPPDCIWTLDGTVQGTKDIGADQGMPGMIEDYLYEFQFYKLDGQYPSGQYTGDMYANVKLDCSKAFQNMFAGASDISQSLNLNMDVYGLTNAISFNIYNFWNYQQYGFIWPPTSDQDGKDVTPSRDQYVGEGDVAMNFKGSGDVGGQVTDPNATYTVSLPGINGDGESDIKVRFVIEPNSVWGDSFYSTSTGSRKVTIYLFDGQNWLTGEGTLNRQPGGLENQTKFANDPPKSLGEKYGKDSTDADNPSQVGAKPSSQNAPQQNQPKQPSQSAPGDGSSGSPASDPQKLGDLAPDYPFTPSGSGSGSSNQPPPQNTTPWNNNAPADATLGDLAPDSQKLGDLAPDSQKLGDLAPDSQKLGDLAPDSQKLGDLAPDYPLTPSGSGGNGSNQPPPQNTAPWNNNAPADCPLQPLK